MPQAHKIIWAWQRFAQENYIHSFAFFFSDYTIARGASNFERSCTFIQMLKFMALKYAHLVPYSWNTENTLYYINLVNIICH